MGAFCGSADSKGVIRGRGAILRLRADKAGTSAQDSHPHRMLGYSEAHYGWDMPNGGNSQRSSWRWGWGGRQWPNSLLRGNHDFGTRIQLGGRPVLLVEGVREEQWTKNRATNG